jgi:hypothetical protein
MIQIDEADFACAREAVVVCASARECYLCALLAWVASQCHHAAQAYR